MRLELALIVGILFFCSWCAYIVARMNASVSPGADQAPSSRAAAHQQHQQQPSLTSWTHSNRSAPMQTLNSMPADFSNQQYQAQVARQLANQSQAHSLPVASREQYEQAGELAHVAPAQANWQQANGVQPPYATLGQHSPLAYYAQTNQNHQNQALIAQPPGQVQSYPFEPTTQSQWQAYALPTSLQSQTTAPVGNNNEFGPAPELLDDDEAQRRQPLAQEVAVEEDEDAPAAAIATMNSDYATPQVQDDEEAASGPGESEGEENGEDEQQPDEQPAGQGDELDEVAQRRSFTELESDSSERDKDGRLVVTRRRHLINGKPAKPKKPRRKLLASLSPSSVDYDEQEEAEAAPIMSRRRVEQSAPPPQSISSQASQADGDFERLVNEIDQEDKLRKRTQETGQQQHLEFVPAAGRAPVEAQESRRHDRRQEADNEPTGSRSGLFGRSDALNSAGNQLATKWNAENRQRRKETLAKPSRGSNLAVPLKVERKEKKKKRKKDKRDQHEHRLQESLTQQQWDDDSASSSEKRPPKSELSSGSEGEDESGSQVSDIVEQDEEARQLEGMSRELLLNPDFAELTRRRRSTLASEQQQQQEKLEVGENLNSGHDQDDWATQASRMELANEVETTTTTSKPATLNAIEFDDSAESDSSERQAANEAKEKAKEKEFELAASNEDYQPNEVETTGTRLGVERRNAPEMRTNSKRVGSTSTSTSALAPDDSNELALDGQPAFGQSGDSVSNSTEPNGLSNSSTSNQLPSAQFDDDEEEQEQHEEEASPDDNYGKRLLKADENQEQAQAGQLIESSFGRRNTMDLLGGDKAPGQLANELVKGQEDVHVEVLAQPPGQLAANHSAFSSLGAPSLVPIQQSQQAGPFQLTQNPTGLAHFPRVASPFASGSSKVAKKKKKKKGSRKFTKKHTKSMDSKYKAARAYANKQKSRQKKGQMRKKKRKSEKKLVAGKRHFAGSTRGLKQKLGKGEKGARKGATFFKDKGYKKKGFKRAYHKLETGDHKTYFDEFRDKDHSKKWKNFDDKHKYSQKKKWAGHDLKQLRHHNLKEARGKASKSGKWNERAVSEHMRKANKFKKAKEVAAKSMSSKQKKLKKKKKKKI